MQTHVCQLMAKPLFQIASRLSVERPPASVFQHVFDEGRHAFRRERLLPAGLQQTVQRPIASSMLQSQETRAPNGLGESAPLPLAVVLGWISSSFLRAPRSDGA